MDKNLTKTSKPYQHKSYILGAPFNIGDQVQVMDNPNNDDTFDKSFSGKYGIVEYFDYDCGCGQSYPEDPMIGVRFINNKTFEFWKEELRFIEP